MISRLVFLIPLFAVCSFSVDVPTDFNTLRPSDRCDESYCNFITSSVLTTATSYFSDNPRGQDQPISSQEWQWDTPEALFKSYYGPAASVANFKQVCVYVVI